MDNSQLLVRRITVLVPDNQGLVIPKDFRLLYKDPTGRVYSPSVTNNNKSAHVDLIVYTTKYRGKYYGPSELIAWRQYNLLPSNRRILGSPDKHIPTVKDTSTDGSVSSDLGSRSKITISNDSTGAALSVSTPISVTVSPANSCSYNGYNNNSPWAVVGDITEPLRPPEYSSSFEIPPPACAGMALPTPTVSMVIANHAATAASAITPPIIIADADAVADSLISDTPNYFSTNIDDTKSAPCIKEDLIKEIKPAVGLNSFKAPATTNNNNNNNNNNSNNIALFNSKPLPIKIQFSEKILEYISKSFLLVVPTYDIRFLFSGLKLSARHSPPISLIAETELPQQRYETISALSHVIKRISQNSLANIANGQLNTMLPHWVSTAGFPLKPKIIAVQHLSPFPQFSLLDINKMYPHCSDTYSAVQVPMSLHVLRHLVETARRLKSFTGNTKQKNPQTPSLFSDTVYGVWNILALNSAAQLAAIPHSWEAYARGYIRSRVDDELLTGPDGLMLPYQSGNPMQFYVTSSGATAYDEWKVRMASSADNYDVTTGTLRDNKPAGAKSGKDDQIKNTVKLTERSLSWCKGAVAIMDVPGKSGSLQENIALAYGISLFPTNSGDVTREQIIAEINAKTRRLREIEEDEGRGNFDDSSDDVGCFSCFAKRRVR